MIVNRRLRMIFSREHTTEKHFNRTFRNLSHLFNWRKNTNKLLLEINVCTIAVHAVELFLLDWLPAKWKHISSVISTVSRYLMVDECVSVRSHAHAPSICLVKSYLAGIFQSGSTVWLCFPFLVADGTKHTHSQPLSGRAVTEKSNQINLPS